MITTLLAASLMLSCNPKEILEPTINFSAFVVIDGDTVKTRDDKALMNKVSKNTKLGLFEIAVVGDTILTYKDAIKSKPSRKPDLVKLKNNNIPELKGQKFKLVAAGGDLSLGMRDGGIFNEGMLTCFPNLIANQMGVDFKNPLFDASEYNGYGRKVFTTYNPTGGSIPKQKEVSNNLAIQDGALKKYSGATDNFYLDGDRGSPTYKPNAQRLKTGGYAFGASNDPNNENIGNAIASSNKKFDFIFVDIGLQNVLGNVRPGDVLGVYGEETNLENLKKVNVGDQVKIAQLLPTGYNGPIYSTFFQLLVSKQLNRGVIINCPSLKDIPYFAKDYSPEIAKVMNTYQISNVYGSLLKDNYILGNAKIDSIIAPKVNINSKPGVNGQSIITNKNNYGQNRFVYAKSSLEEIHQNINILNRNVLTFSQYSQMPLFDINNFYQEIRRRDFLTEDGVKVDPSWPKGNFFSSDGINLSAFGQAVISNEIIKIMNSFYKMDIELIQTKAYLK